MTTPAPNPARLRARQIPTCDRSFFDEHPQRRHRLRVPATPAEHAIFGAYVGGVGDRMAVLVVRKTTAGFVAVPMMVEKHDCIDSEYRAKHLFERARIVRPGLENAVYLPAGWPVEGVSP